MCGITLVLTADEPQNELPGWPKVIELLSRRGPDVQSCHELDIPGTKWHISGRASTLWTQGHRPTEQPIVAESGSFLLWNGDSYSNEPTGETSDSEMILTLFEERGSPLNVLPSIRGPYSFVYYDSKTRSIWFGRDPIGRCSLLMHKTEVRLVLGSVFPKCLEAQEVSSCGLFHMTFTASTYETTIYPWSDTKSGPLLDFVTRSTDSLRHKILDRNIRPDWLEKEPDVEEVYSNEKKALAQSSSVEILKAIYEKKNISNMVDDLAEVLRDSVRLRVKTKPTCCKRCEPEPGIECLHSKIAVLFSGGLDSTILALMAHQVLEPLETIDLLNVAFKKRNSKASDAPDRLTGHLAIEELRQIAPERKWNFVEITIGESEVDEQIGHIADLIHPLASVLDESLGCALWFASRGCGLLGSDAYCSPARIVLVGMGADELFGGYSRHAALFRRAAPWLELSRSLQEELQNIGFRNLGRDNRIISDHGRMMRAPFLDEAFVTHVSRLPPWLRCCPDSILPRGVGDKTLLRMVALSLGLRGTAVQPKRAMQFGTRIANPKQKGHQVSVKLKDTI
ncbi:asparagine synthetase [Nesidiocoris tenuis]|uniref:Asparagine synthetase n=1 Tax=Nesidiocoris tenuis TaxID=355587 RepID=A0ABN7B5W4_9HEMI|nr:asparagine synthetase [Nesidiocoris tenuis]